MSTITTIQSTDLITNSRADINNNFSALNTDKIETSVLDTDTTLSANTDDKVATQRAVKAYVDAGGNVNASTTAKGIVEEATDAEVLSGTAVGTTGARLFVNPTSVSALKPDTTTYEYAGSPHTWTKPTGLTQIYVKMWGGGGGGSGQLGITYKGAGGGGGYVEKWILASELGSTETITIGAGGAGGSNNGVDGGDTTFGSLLTALGGKKGSASAGSAGDVGGAGGFPIQVYPLVGTGTGQAGLYAGAGGEDGQNGGASYFGGGGGGGGTTGTGGVSTFGGNGGAANNAGSVPGGGGGATAAGGNGRCIVTEYYV